MTIYQWTGNAGTGNFASAGNWKTATTNPATEPPGSSDTAIIENAATPITGTGTAEVLYFAGTDMVEGHLSATYGSPVNARLTLLPGATLTTNMLHIAVEYPPGTIAPTAGMLTVGKHSSVVISGCHSPDTYGIQLADIAGSNGKLVVQGEQAVVNTGNLPMSIGQGGTGALTISEGGVVSVGNGDPLIYPWPLVIANHPTSTGTVEVSHGSLLAHGQVLVGRKATGSLTVNEGGLVVAEDMAIGWAPNGGQGSVMVTGDNARLIVDNLLEVQHMGIGSLSVTEHGFVSAGIAITVNGTLSLADGRIETTALGVNTGATLSGYGTVIAIGGINNNGGSITAEQQLNLIGNIDNTGTITVAVDGDLRCFGAIDDTGSITLQADSVASLEAVTSGQTITFGGNNARLVLRSPGAFSGQIKDFGPTHSIEMEAEATSINFAGGVLTVIGTLGDLAQLQMIGPYTNISFHLAPGAHSVITFV